MEYKKYSKLVNITKKKRTRRYREQTSASVGRGRGEGQYRVGDSEVQTVMYKISYKDILYNTGNIADIL